MYNSWLSLEFRQGIVALEFRQGIVAVSQRDTSRILYTLSSNVIVLKYTSCVAKSYTIRRWPTQDITFYRTAPDDKRESCNNIKSLRRLHWKKERKPTHLTIFSFQSSTGSGLEMLELFKLISSRHACRAYNTQVRLQPCVWNGLNPHITIHILQHYVLCVPLYVGTQYSPSPILSGKSFSHHKRFRHHRRGNNWK